MLVTPHMYIVANFKFQKNVLLQCIEKHLQLSLSQLKGSTYFLRLPKGTSIMCRGRRRNNHS